MDAVQPNLKVTNEAQLERFIVQKFAKAFIPMPDRSIKRSGWLAPFPLARELALVTSQNSSCFLSMQMMIYITHESAGSHC